MSYDITHRALLGPRPGPRDYRYAAQRTLLAGVITQDSVLLGSILKELILADRFIMKTILKELILKELILKELILKELNP